MFQPVYNFEFGILIRESWKPLGSMISGYEIPEMDSV